RSCGRPISCFGPASACSRSCARAWSYSSWSTSSRAFRSPWASWRGPSGTATGDSRGARSGDPPPKLDESERSPSLLALLRVRHREVDEEEHGEVVVLRASYSRNLASHHRVRLRIEFVDPHLGLPAIALPLEEGDLGDGEVDHGSLEGGKADEGRVHVGAQDGGEDPH